MSAFPQPPVPATCATCPSHARPSAIRRLLVVLVATLTAVLGLALPAAAHTQLIEALPADGDLLDRPFEEVALSFSRAVELLPRAMTVSGADGAAASTLVTQERSDDGTVVTVRFDPPLYAGSWTLAWRVLAGDGHPREGEVTVAVDDAVQPPPPEVAEPSADADAGTGTPAPGADATDGDGSGASDRAGVAPPAPPRPTVDRATLERLGDLSRVLHYLGLMVALGIALFKAGPHRGERLRVGGLALAMGLGAVVGLVGGLGEGVFHVASLSGLGLPGAFDGLTWSAVLRTGLGTSLVLRTVGLTLIGLSAVRRFRARTLAGPDAVTLLGVGAVVLSMQFVGHTASTAPEWAIRLADLVHVVAGAIWVGGLVGLAILSTHHDRPGRARTAARFSDIAGLSVVAVAVAGSTMAALTMPGPAALTGTTYGRILLVKLGLVGILGVVGAYNHYAVVPRLVDGDNEAVDQLRRTVAVEVVVVLVIIALTGVLVSQSPF